MRFRAESEGSPIAEYMMLNVAVFIGAVGDLGRGGPAG